MPRTNTTAPTDAAGWRNFGDGLAAPMVAARLQGYNTANADYRDVAVDASGNLLAALTASAIEIGTVDQGTGGSSAWKVDGSAVTQPVSATSLPLPTGAAKDSTLTDGTQRIGGSVAVTIAAMPSTPVTGPLTDTQLRASAVPVSLATVPSHDVTNAGTFAVQATLAAETTKVIGTVNQGTSPWVTSRNWTLSSGTDSVAVSNTGFNATGSDGITTQPATVQQINGRYLLFVRDPEVNKTLTDILFQLRSNNT